MVLQKTYGSSTATIAFPAANVLGEGPVWHGEGQSLFWVDIEGKQLQELKWPTLQFQSWPMPQMIGMVVPYNENNLVVALQGGLALFHLKTGQLDWLTEVEKDTIDNRPNDGKCDSKGRLWLGTMHKGANVNSGSLYCLQQNLITSKLTSLTISNGMAWSRDDKHFYFIDSSLQRIDQYVFDPITGDIVFERTAITIPPEMGLPDGMTIDEEGMLWVAQWGGFCVCRWDPNTGALLHKIEVPVPQVTSCTFGGENLDVLFITTARVGLSEEILSKHPESGHVFSVQTEVRGFLPYNFQNQT
jgi:sugar lactone lactonase YvrE